VYMPTARARQQRDQTPRKYRGNNKEWSVVAFGQSRVNPNSERQALCIENVYPRGGGIPSMLQQRGQTPKNV